MIKTKPKLIFLWNYVEWGGAQIYLLAIMKRARELFDIKVILPSRSLPDILSYLDKLSISYEFTDACLDISPAPTIRAKILRQWRRIHAEWTSFRYLMRYDLRSSILHIEAAPWQSWILFTALAARGANIFVTMHNIMPRASAWREMIWKMRMQFVSRLPGFHMFPSNQDTKDRLKGWVSDTFFDNMEVTYTAVNPEEIAEVSNIEVDVAEMRRKYGLDPNKFLVLCVGQFIDRKGRWIFLGAAKKIAETHDEVTFAWLTPKMPDDSDQIRIAEYGLGDTFKLILSGTVGDNRHDVLSFFRVADAFALVSYVEGLPISLLEAMALGLPCISTNINAIPEAVIDDKTGILIEAGSSSALAESVLKLKYDVATRVRLAGNGQEFALNNFDERRVADIVIESYMRSLNCE
ncbi:MAG: glycosyltransferase family 4 protein [Pyrinomonadaceae bacterium]|nr:glycosyltransferase family 4 protein [Acidobacteriota bacterium]MBK7935538.1 glycosyltransferase family 4 protein [Acidobacteriota bacterium]MBP7376840.1 glycosyltransferase family 4 protein [Pyrinomonadaceae bacterium]